MHSKKFKLKEKGSKEKIPGSEQNMLPVLGWLSVGGRQLLKERYIETVAEVNRGT